MAWDKKATLKILEKLSGEMGSAVLEPKIFRKKALEAQNGVALSDERLEKEVRRFIINNGDLWGRDFNFGPMFLAAPKMGGVCLDVDHPALEGVLLIQVIDASRLPDDDELLKITEHDILYLIFEASDGEVVVCIIERPEKPAAE